ncbi:hypothetical protein FACS1894122_06570 [Alphaproteobacteria bacterium]|nr:hypothetical protein FACS1894122_06570 [Alphaproteobacteria bacterium]
MTTEIIMHNATAIKSNIPNYPKEKITHYYTLHLFTTYIIPIFSTIMGHVRYVNVSSFPDTRIDNNAVIDTTTPDKNAF